MSLQKASVLRRHTRPVVEQLEDRRLLSVTVLPGQLNLKSAGHGHGVFTVRLLGNTSAGKILVQDNASALQVSVTVNGTTQSLGSPLRTHVLGDGDTSSPGLLLKFHRSVLQGLSSGPATLTVTDGTNTETGTFDLFSPGGHGHNGSHSETEHGHGHS
jgi:hypothetical protein